MFPQMTQFPVSPQPGRHQIGCARLRQNPKPTILRDFGVETGIFVGSLERRAHESPSVFQIPDVYDWAKINLKLRPEKRKKTAAARQLQDARRAQLLMVVAGG